MEEKDSARVTSGGESNRTKKRPPRYMGKPYSFFKPDQAVEKALPAQIAQTITNLEQMLNFWQDKVESDEKQRKAYAFPDMVKHLMIEY